MLVDLSLGRRDEGCEKSPLLFPQLPLGVDVDGAAGQLADVLPAGRGCPTGRRDMFIIGEGRHQRRVARVCGTRHRPRRPHPNHED